MSRTDGDLGKSVREIVSEVAEIDAGRLVDGASFADVGIDSLMAIEIVVHIEHRFELHFEEDEMKNLTTIDDLVRLTRGHLPNVS